MTASHPGSPCVTIAGLLIGVLIGLVLLASDSPFQRPKAVGAVNPPPNIVVVITDDQPQLDGRLLNFMPTLKSVFLDHGVTFSDFHGETNQCCPGRAGFLSGQHTPNHHVKKNSADLFDPAMSIATQLHGIDYFTFQIGKYMNGYGGTCKKHLNNCRPNVPPGWDRFAAIDPDTCGSCYYNYDMWVDGDPIPVHYGSAPEDYSTDVISQRAVDVINVAPTDRPLFGWLAPPNPHAPNEVAPRHADAPCDVPPWAPPNYNEADVSDKPAWVQAIGIKPDKRNPLPRKCRSLLAVDDLIANVQNALAAQNRLDNTIFIFTGDNGEASREHRLNGKGDPYQTTLPFLVSWPAKLGTTPVTVEERLQNIDLAPTLCALAGCSMGPYPNGQATPDGWNFAELLLGSQTTIGRDAVFEDMPAGNRPAPPWYAVTTTKQSPLANQVCASADSGGCIWHYIEYPTTGEKELYDKSNGPCWTWEVGQVGDPCELDNLLRSGSTWADDPPHASLLRSLQTRLAQLRVEKGH